MYTFYFKQVTDKNQFEPAHATPHFQLVAFRGEIEPSIFKLGAIYTLQELPISRFRIVLDGDKIGRDSGNTKMFYAKGYRGPEKLVNKSVVYTDQEEDLLVQSLIFGPSGCETPSIGPLPPQAPISQSWQNSQDSISQKSQDELEPLPGAAIPESGIDWSDNPIGRAAGHVKSLYSPGDLEKLKRELREQFEKGDPNRLYEAPQGTILDPRDSAKADAAKVEALDTANSVKWNCCGSVTAADLTWRDKLKNWFWGTSRVGF